MWLRSASTISGPLALLCALPFLSGCLLVAGANYATHDVECEAMRSDHERGVVSTAWNQSKCDQVEKDRVEEARKVVREVDQQKNQADNSPTGMGEPK